MFDNRYISHRLNYRADVVGAPASQDERKEGLKLLEAKEREAYERFSAEFDDYESYVEHVENAELTLGSTIYWDENEGFILENGDNVNEFFF